MTKMTTSCIFSEEYNNLNLRDLSEFRALKVFSVIKSLSDYFDKNLSYFSISNMSIVLPFVTAPGYLKKSSYLAQDNDNLIVPIETEIALENHIQSIVVKFEESYDYAEFNEYDINNDIFNNSCDYESITECLREQQDCSYIQSYSYSIYLDIYTT